MDIQHILRKLPHRYPFLLVDRVLEIEKGVRIKALKNVTINEPFFPRALSGPAGDARRADARSPGAGGGLLSFASLEGDPPDDMVVYFAGIDNARFKRPVGPGDQLILEAAIDRAKSGIYRYKARATVDGALVVEADLMCTMRTAG
jgi:3-hydroxyacyl-[acyl-carrier-protein] dehydratase